MSTTETPLDDDGTADVGRPGVPQGSELPRTRAAVLAGAVASRVRRALADRDDPGVLVACHRCEAPYHPRLVDGCPVCGLDAVGYDAEAADRRLLITVVSVTALNLLLLAGLVLVIG